MDNLITVCHKCHTPRNHKPGGKLYGWKPKVKGFKGATFMTAVRWILYGMVKKALPDVEIHLTYGAATKVRRGELDIKKSHVNDAFVMGNFHPGHRARPQIYQKKRRNNRSLEKFYDAKYIDTRTGEKQTGQQLSNGRISRNHKKDSENLHKYRGRRCLPEKGRSERYVIKSRRMTLYGTTAENARQPAAIAMEPGQCS